ncbi:hypothetical protein [Shouchella shacheensis]|uniref:hypothetical protein n=1 Tax=Shouchella shacheensis TaxID=1649580 RepID=UPI0012F8E6C9|nr:hypothetical protein [Shouchella shacheensis]
MSFYPPKLDKTGERRALALLSPVSLHQDTKKLADRPEDLLDKLATYDAPSRI